MQNAIIMIPVILNSNLAAIKGNPSPLASNVSIGIFVVDHAPINIYAFRIELSFFSIIAATRNAAYNGPTAADPN